MKLNRLSIVFAVAALLLVAWLLAPIAQEEQILAPMGVSDRYEFGGSKTLGQYFVPPTGLTSISIPIGSQQVPNGPLILHLRHEYFGKDIRTSTVFSHHEEESLVQFSFTPLINPPEKLLWVLEAPHSEQESLWAYREVDATAYPDGTSFTNNKKIAGNFGFTLVHYDLQGEALLDEYTAATDWEKQSLVVGFVVALVLVLISPYFVTVRNLGRMPSYLLIGMVLLSIVAHAIYVKVMPVINDEGAYVQDALQSTVDFWPLRDFLTKGPLYIMLLKLWLLVTPHTIVFWRLLSIVSWGITVYFVAKLAQALTLSKTAQWIAVACVAVLPVAVALTTPLLLQVVSTMVVVGAIYLLLRALERGSTNLIMAASAAMVAAYCIRASSSVGAVMGVFLIVIFAREKRLHSMAVYIVTGVAIAVAIFLISTVAIGYAKTIVLFNFEAFLIAQNRTVTIEIDREPFIRLLTERAEVLWRAAPLLLAGVVLAPIVALRRRSLMLLTILGLSVTFIVGLIGFNLIDMNYLLPTTLPIVRMTILFLVFLFPGIVFAISILVPRSATQNIPSESLKPFLFCVVWLVLLYLLYDHWGRFRHSYWVEFLIPLSLLSAWSFSEMSRLWQRIEPRWFIPIGNVIVLTLVIASIFQGTHLMLQYPPTGNISAKSLEEISAIIDREVPVGTPLFTAQPAVTAYARRPIVFGYAHPGWYREERFGTVSSQLRQLFFKEPEELTQYLKDEALYVLYERRTFEIYFDGYPERNNILKQSFTEIARIENDALSEPFILYKRR